MTLSVFARCNMDGYVPPVASYFAELGGWGIKIEGDQFNVSPHMETNYPAGTTNDLPNGPPVVYTESDTTAFKPGGAGAGSRTKYSVYHDLDHLTWLRFIQIDIEPGTYETSQGVYDFSVLHRIFQIVDNLQLPKGQNKKIYLQIITKSFGVANALNMLAPYMRTTGNQGAKSANYETGFPRYDYLWGYISTSIQDGASPFGYHYRFADMRAGLTGTDRAGRAIGFLLERQLAFYSQFYNEFKVYRCLGGFMTTEGIPVTRSSTAEYPTASGKSSYDDTEFDRNQHFAGRLNWLKQLKAIFTDHVLIEACHHDNTWEADMVGAGRNVDGAIINHFGVTGPNSHTGSNLDALNTSKTNCKDIVFLYGQIQPQDMKTKNGGITKSGANNDCFNWVADPDHVPPYNVSGPNPFGPLVEVAGITGGQIPDPEFLIMRQIWFGMNGSCYQHNYDFANNPNDWDTFRAAFEASTIISANTGGLIKDDPWGGLNKFEPTNLI